MRTWTSSLDETEDATSIAPQLDTATQSTEGPQNVTVGVDRKEHLRGRPFVPFILDIVQDAGCGPGPILLYGALVCCLAKYGKIPFGESREVLAGTLGVDPRTVTRWLKSLRRTKNGRKRGKKQASQDILLKFLRVKLPMMINVIK